MANESSLKVRVQKFGSFLSSMVMPNIAAFIAWGLITALFIPKGWIPNETFVQLVGPMLFYGLPILIAYTGGKLIHDVRGGVVGVIAAIGVIVGAPETPMLMGAMIVGPLGGWVIKKFDTMIDGKIATGFEMLVNNFSAGIIGGVLALLSVIGIGPVLSGITNILAAGVSVLVSMKLLPLVHIFVEPAKVLFLNNAINHGVFAPIALEQAAAAGKSILFMVESNPGPGLGILLAYSVFGKGSEKSSAWGATIIHFFGGIHEIYFPYILMKPILLLAAMAGGMVSTTIFMVMKIGLVATPSPGSIIAYSLMTPKSDYLGMFIGVAAGTVVSFIVASALLKGTKDSSKDMSEAIAEMEAGKGKKSAIAGSLVEGSSKTYADVKTVIFACDAGMGSSAMGASVLRKKVKDAGIQGVTVVNLAVSKLTPDADLIVTQKELAERARGHAPDAILVSVDNFMNSPRYDEVVENLKAVQGAAITTGTQIETIGEEKEICKIEVLQKKNILKDQKFANKEEAIRKIGDIFVEDGYTTEKYTEGMIAREVVAPTNLGIGISIPHGVIEVKSEIKQTGLVVLLVPEGIDWNGENIKMVVGIAGAGDAHLEILANIANSIGTKEVVDAIVAEQNVDKIHAIMTAKED